MEICSKLSINEIFQWLRSFDDKILLMNWKVFIWTIIRRNSECFLIIVFMNTYKFYFESFTFFGFQKRIHYDWNLLFLRKRVCNILYSDEIFYMYRNKMKNGKYKKLRKIERQQQYVRWYKFLLIRRLTTWQMKEYYCQNVIVNEAEKYV